jgi:DNA-directed RNA polymerase subunit RPC12/RpoP
MNDRVKMAPVTDPDAQAMAAMGSLSRIEVEYQCAECGQLLPRKDHGDGVFEISAQCPNCKTINAPRID